MVDVVVLFFLLGVFAALVRSDLRLPEALYETLSIFLLLAIGLKGGIEMSKQPLGVLAPQVLACVLLGLTIPVVLVPVLRRLGLSALDSAAVAAHYGSVSVVTFAVAQAWLQRKGIPFEQHAPLWVAIMEAPGILSGILIARLVQRGDTVNWKQLAHDVFFGKSVLLLVGGITIGAVMGEAGTASIQPVFVTMFKGVLALFLLEMGLIAAAQAGNLRRHGVFLVAFAVVMPLVSACIGGGLGALMGLSVGGIAMLATLAASASYIAVPAAMRLAVPEANPALSLAAALGVTFPFNVLIGIPLYHRAAVALFG